MANESEKGQMTVEEAGRKGGQKGGRRTAETQLLKRLDEWAEKKHPEPMVKNFIAKLVTKAARKFED